MAQQTDSTAHDVPVEAEKLRELDVAGAPLILANVWDPTSARMVESAGTLATGASSNALAPVNEVGRTNVLYISRSAKLEELARLGVASIRVACFLFRVLMKRLQSATAAPRHFDEKGLGPEWEGGLLEPRL